MRTLARAGCAAIGWALACAGANASCKYRLTPQAVERQIAIEDEVAAIGVHEWAGEYHAGSESGYDVQVTLAPKAGVVTVVTGSLGIQLSEEDTVQQELDGSLRMPWPGYCIPDTAIWPVRWGERHYLVLQSELEGFVSAINLGDEPRQVPHETYLLRKGDHKRTVVGLPDLPPAYQAHIRTRPLVLHPVAIEPIEPTPNDSFLCERSFTVHFDAGTEQGLAVGTELLAVGHNRHTRAHLGAVSAHAAMGSVHVTAIRCEELVPPDASWEFTTGAYRL